MHIDLRLLGNMKFSCSTSVQFLITECQTHETPDSIMPETSSSDSSFSDRYALTACLPLPHPPCAWVVGALVVPCSSSNRESLHCSALGANIESVNTLASILSGISADLLHVLSIVSQLNIDDPSVSAVRSRLVSISCTATAAVWDWVRDTGQSLGSLKAPESHWLFQEPCCSRLGAREIRLRFKNSSSS